AVAVAGREEVRFAFVAALPERADGVDDEAGGQGESRCDAGFAGGTADAAPDFGNGATGGEQGRAGGAVDRTVHAAAAEQGFVRRVHDRVDAEFAKVGFDDPDHGRTMDFRVEKANTAAHPRQ